MPQPKDTAPEPAPSDFIRDIVAAEIQQGLHATAVTRFPPEPNGYLHIGHAKSICLNFGIGGEFPNGRTHLRFDDTNPVKEDVEYVESIQEDVRWLGFDWGKHLYYASDYFDQIHAWALELIDKGLAYVCDLDGEGVRQTRGTPTQPGSASPYRERSVSENRDLFERMRQGEFPDGARTLRAKIDMAHPNLNMRDPVLYRIKKVHHDRTGDKWCIYPTYDMAHGYSDALEGITHSVCTLEFEDHRPLYEWLIDNVSAPCRPRQIEFARLNLSYTVMSKRKLLQLVEEKLVDGWTDPRMPTISAMRRRGYTPEGIRQFCRKIGVTKTKGLTDVALLEHCIREDLNKTSVRRVAVLRPIKVVLTNYPEDQQETITLANNPEDPEAGMREVSFTRELWIESEDFLENPPPKFFRLSPGAEVRLRSAYNIQCQEVIKNALGHITEVRCTYDPASRHSAPKKGTAAIHWLSAATAQNVEVRLYEPLFTLEDFDTLPEKVDYRDYLNPQSLEVLPNAKVEPIAMEMVAGERCQFERLGYFCVDNKDSHQGRPIFNRTIPLKSAKSK